MADEAHSYVQLPELSRIRSLPGDRYARARIFADACRINALYMIAHAGSGHIGTSFSSMDIVSWLHLEVLRDEDLYFSSKGHDVPALYAVLIALGRLPFDSIHELRRLEGLPGHPDVRVTPQVVTSTGSLGMGVSKAKGFATAQRLAGESGRIFVLTGDGELQEGQFWESLPGAVNRKLADVVVIIDHNKIQSDTWVEQVSDLGSLEAKLDSFGWATARCNGHDMEEFDRELTQLLKDDRPKVLIADTTKGAGASVFTPRADEPLYAHHSGAPKPDEYVSAVEELVTRCNARFEVLAQPPLTLARADRPPSANIESPQRLIAAYSEALVEVASAEQRVVVLDADLVLDCGLIPFSKRYPPRFIECGIAEQDMVSQAGALALAGHIPIVHSFASFLSTRANEQIFNNATEGTKVVYVGSLAGLVPGGPGHSHQSVRDLALFGSVPGMSVIEPFSEGQVSAALQWAVTEAEGPVYIRLVSVPWDVPLPASVLHDRALALGRGVTLRDGKDVVLITSGPILVGEACAASDDLQDRVDCGIVALPWVAPLDVSWLTETIAGRPVVCIDNHVSQGGLGDAVVRALNGVGSSPPSVRVLAVNGIPVSGQNEEVLRHHGLDRRGIRQAVLGHIGARV